MASTTTKITEARGYNAALGAIYSPTDTVNYLADRLEADGVQITRTSDGGFYVGPADSPVMAAVMRRAAFVRSDDAVSA